MQHTPRETKTAAPLEKGAAAGKAIPENTIARTNNAAGVRFLALCLTWRQYAANDHGSTVFVLQRF
jgi:hypothetical protein